MASYETEIQNFNKNNNKKEEKEENKKEDNESDSEKNNKNENNKKNNDSFDSDDNIQLKKEEKNENKELKHSNDINNINIISQNNNLDNIEPEKRINNCNKIDNYKSNNELKEKLEYPSFSDDDNKENNKFDNNIDFNQNFNFNNINDSIDEKKENNNIINNNKNNDKEEKVNINQNEKNKSSSENSMESDDIKNKENNNNYNIKRKDSESSSEENMNNKDNRDENEIKEDENLKNNLKINEEEDIKRKENEIHKANSDNRDNKNYINLNDYVNINLSVSDKNNIRINTKNNINNINKINNLEENNNINNDFVNIELEEEIKDNNNNDYPDLDTINKNTNNNPNNNNINFSFEIIGEEEQEKLRILSGKNLKPDLSNFDPNDDIVDNSKSSINFFRSDSQNKKSNIREIMRLYNLLLEEDKEELKSREYFIVSEKDDITDFMGKHKSYEIAFVNSANVKSIKSYRRYKHFFLLNEKLKKTYPYIIIPRLPPQKNISKIIYPDKVFEDDRLAQLNFYINFIFLHQNLKKTKEFFKFIEDAVFDESYFNPSASTNQIMTPQTHDDLDLSGMNINYLDEITTKNRNYSLSGSLSTIWNFFVPYHSSNNKKREINDSEIIIKKMDIHFNNIINQYTLIAENIEKIFKSNEAESIANKRISEAFLYLKDAFAGKNKNMNEYHEQTKILSERQIESVKKASKLKHKLSALINLLHGICWTLEKYLNFIKKYNKLTDKMNKAKAAGNKGKYLDDLVNQYQIYERVKNKFELQLSKETNIYCQIYDETTYYCLLKFREVLESSTIVKIKGKEEKIKEEKVKEEKEKDKDKDKIENDNKK